MGCKKSIIYQKLRRSSKIILLRRLNKKTEYPCIRLIFGHFLEIVFLSYMSILGGWFMAIFIFWPYFSTIQNLTNVLKIILSFLILFISYQTELFDGRPDVLIFAYCLFI